MDTATSFENPMQTHESLDMGNLTEKTDETDLPIVEKTLADEKKNLDTDFDKSTNRSTTVTYEKLSNNGPQDQKVYDENGRGGFRKFMKQLMPSKKMIVLVAFAVAMLVFFLIAVVLFVTRKETGTGTCKRPPKIQNGTTNHLTGSKHGDTFEILCNEGYELIGASRVTCLSSSQWSPIAYCALAKCEPLVVPQHAEMTKDTDRGLNGDDGVSITIACKEGYEMEGNDTVICQRNKTWSKPPICSAVDCGYPSYIRRGMIKDLAGTTVNHTFSVQCCEGSVLRGPQNVVCKSNGQWSNFPRCERVSCGMPSTPDHGSITHFDGIAFNSTSLFSCDEGFILTGNPLAVCNSNGSWSESPSCNKIVNGGYSEWTNWDQCTVTCGGGTQERYRTCTNPKPQYGGTECTGESSEQKSCSTTNCPVNGGYSEWTKWDECTVSCGGGTQKRSRSCTNPSPSFGGDMCTGNRSQQKSCNTIGCSVSCLAETSQNDCQPGEMCVDLNQQGTVSGSLSGVATLTGPTGLQGGKECSRQATFKVTFDKLPSSSTGLCHTDIYTERRMLKVQMYFSDKYRNSWMFNIGDSPSNNGWAGDSGHTDYAAEIQAYSKTVAVYANNVNRTDCRAQLLYQYNGATNTSTSKVNVWIANHYLKVANDNGLCERNCNKCLYGLNGQYTHGSINQDIYVAANRVVSGSYRNGYGLCFMKMSWVSGPEV